MNKNNIKVLVLENNFSGGHGAFPCFNKELISGFVNNGIEVYVANDASKAMEIYENNDISFSVNIGVYAYYFNGQPLYEKYKILNYQWIIDNPIRYIKYNIDFDSKYNRLIYIDRDFFKVKSREDYLWLSLGGPNNSYSDIVERENAVLVPMDIRDTPEALLNKIEDESMRELVCDFVKDFDFDGSFLEQCQSFINERGIKERNEFILVTNAYTRIQKRIMLISSIKRHKVYIASDAHNPHISGENIFYLPTGDFYNTLELQKKYKFVLNGTPNYDYCVHERITYASCNGAVVISDANAYLNELGFPGVVKYSQLDKMDDIIDGLNANFEDVRGKQRRITENYKMQEAVKHIVDDYLKGAFYEL